jgi:phosphopantothenoylcysteine decarboxylase/phosphopantothenate--cysteine ligase
MANDLATTTLLATDKPVMMAPTMNVMMWAHPATQANVATLQQRGVLGVAPNSGELACGEVGSGRMAEPLEIVAAVERFFATGRPLAGKRALVTSGPTYEPLDPVRFIGNRSSGKQGHAIAGALARLGADVTLVSGPSHEPVPVGVTLVPIETGREMLAAAEGALPADVAVFAAAVSDWRAAEAAPQKLKKGVGGPPALHLVENPDILATIARAGSNRPQLVIGFAAETENVVENARAKRQTKGCDWVVANDVSAGTGVFGGDRNTVHLVTGDTTVEDWPELTKTALADRLAERIAQALAKG